MLASASACSDAFRTDSRPDNILAHTFKLSFQDAQLCVVYVVRLLFSFKHIVQECHAPVSSNRTQHITTRHSLDPVFALSMADLLFLHLLDTWQGAYCIVSSAADPSAAHHVQV